MSQQQPEPERRKRRRALWWLFGVPAVLLLAIVAVYAAIAPGGGPGEKQNPKPGATKAPGFSQVSPPLAATGDGQGKNGQSSGNQGNGNSQGSNGQGNAGTGNNGNGAGGNGQGNNGNGQGNGNAGDNNPPGKALTATVASVTPVWPGHTGTVTITVANPNQQDVLLTGLTSQVTSVGSGTRAGLPRCSKDWFVIGNLSGTPRVSGRSSSSIQVPVTMVDTTNVNQDNCKGITYQFSFTVNGRQA